jgi:transcriptional regulator with XRE-family HTH domain
MPNEKQIALALAVTLRRLRRQRGLSQAELAGQSGITLRQLRALERGLLPPRAAREVAQALRRK